MKLKVSLAPGLAYRLITNLKTAFYTIGKFKDQPPQCPYHNKAHMDTHLYQEEIPGNLQSSSQIAGRTREIAIPRRSYGCYIKTETGLTQ